MRGTRPALKKFNAGAGYRAQLLDGGLLEQVVQPLEVVVPAAVEVTEQPWGYDRPG
jgi:hypothetical protein